MPIAQTIEAPETERVDICDPAQFTDAPPKPEKLITVMCDICHEQAFDTPSVLKRSGWDLHNGLEFCPSHIF